MDIKIKEDLKKNYHSSSTKSNIRQYFRAERNPNLSCLFLKARICLNSRLHNLNTQNSIEEYLRMRILRDHEGQVLFPEITDNHANKHLF